ncbi:aminoglycoside phosphotransferase family protein [Kitasatospora sp. NPDC056446]|uniref:aminoglycoside phosphotransferase family protein n=1 Tax=Kitasatospora sp. NPDC056446 TaxID=3345819 RepID=UPI0036864250
MTDAMTDATPDTGLPPELEAWLAARLPGLDATEDVSWPRETSQVWRVATPTGPVFAKISPSEADHRREVYAYDNVTAAFAEHETPRLLAHDPHLRALLTSPLPGRVVRDLPLDQAAERRAHELAGHLLRRWHAHPAPDEQQVRGQVVTAATVQADEAARCLHRTAATLTPGQRALVARVASDLPGLAAHLPLVYRHGDNSPRNWLWHAPPGAPGSVGLIDFQMADHGAAVNDLVWLHGALWPNRPDLRSAFLTGYGRDLTDTEQQALRLYTARLAVSYLTTGLTEDNTMLVDRGRRVLDHLVHAA